MKIIDISMKITPEMMVYKDRPEKRPEMILQSTHERDGVQETKVTMNVHTGTHMDAPQHMIKNGKTIGDMDLSRLITPCRVLDFSALSGGITKEDLMKKTVNKGEFILLKTRNSLSETFDFEFVFLEKSGAEYLKEKGVRGVGVDALGIERSQPGHETHHILMNSDIPIIEGLRLKEADEGEYTLAALPIRLDTADAAPLRAVLLPAGILTE